MDAKPTPVLRIFKEDERKCRLKMTDLPKKLYPAVVVTLTGTDLPVPDDLILEDDDCLVSCAEKRTDLDVWKSNYSQYVRSRDQPV